MSDILQTASDARALLYSCPSIGIADMAIDYLIAAERDALLAKFEALAAAFQANGDALAPRDDWGDDMASTVAADTLRAAALRLRNLIKEARA